jgi:hypothetical protein
MMHENWADTLSREGLNPVKMDDIDKNGEHPCPACGTAAALVAGACSDCGLQLE